MTENQEKKEKEKFRKTTLKDLGSFLPIFRDYGAQEPGEGEHEKRSREFTFLDWDFDMEEKLADIFANAENIGKAVRDMMKELIDTFEGKNFQEWSEEKKLLTLHQLEFSNMMYMYMYLRYEVMGEEIIMNIPCPFCKKMIKDYTGDLRTLDINVKDREHEHEFHYSLKKPIRLKGIPKPVTGFRVGLSQWAAMENIKKQVNPNSSILRKELFMSSIKECIHDNESVKQGVPMLIDVRSTIKKMKKGDIEKLTALITENNAGPHMVIGGECPHCKGEFIKPIDWGYEDFFGSSSL